eukprot:s1729_g1.t1
MSGFGFHNFVAAAMVLQSVDALSDEDSTRKKTDSTVKRPKAKAESAKKAEPKAKVKVKPGPKSSGSSTGKSKGKGKGGSKSKSAQTQNKDVPDEKNEKDEKDEKEQEEEQEVIPKKKPAASPSVKGQGMKRPAASGKKTPEKEKKKLKVCKYLYHKNHTYGFKVNDKQDAMKAELIRTEGDVAATASLRDSMIQSYMDAPDENAKDLDAAAMDDEEGEEEAADDDDQEVE